MLFFYATKNKQCAQRFPWQNAWPNIWMKCFIGTVCLWMYINNKNHGNKIWQRFEILQNYFRESETEKKREILASLNVKPIKSKWGARNPMWHPINHILLQIHDSSDKRHRLHQMYRSLDGVCVCVWVRFFFFRTNKMKRCNAYGEINTIFLI